MALRWLQKARKCKERSGGRADSSGRETSSVSPASAVTSVPRKSIAPSPGEPEREQTFECKQFLMHSLFLMAITTKKTNLVLLLFILNARKKASILNADPGETQISPKYLRRADVNVYYASRMIFLYFRPLFIFVLVK